jgi:hypothetical protein
VICRPCRDAKHEQCANPLCIRMDGEPVRYGTWCDCQHKPRGDGLVLSAGKLEG